MYGRTVSSLPSTITWYASILPLAISSIIFLTSSNIFSIVSRDISLDFIFFSSPSLANTSSASSPGIPRPRTRPLTTSFPRLTSSRASSTVRDLTSGGGGGGLYSTPLRIMRSLISRYSVEYIISLFLLRRSRSPLGTSSTINLYVSPLAPMVISTIRSVPTCLTSMILPFLICFLRPDTRGVGCFCSLTLCS